MLIEDPTLFSLVIPTWQGTPFLRRCLDYLKAEKYRGHLLLSDDSSGEHRAFVESCPERYPELRMDVHCFEPGTRFLVKLARSLERLTARYVMLCGQDDFIIPRGVEQTLLALRSDPTLSCARGRVARFHVNRAADGRAESVKMMHHNMRAYGEPLAVERVLAHIRSFSATLYSVHRREDLIDSFLFTERATKNVIFFQYLSSCVVVARGRIAVVEDLFLVRQAHEGSWAAQLLGNYEHWPLLIASPHYSNYYQEFRSALVQLLGAEPGADARLGARIDAAYVDLVKRSFCQSEPFDQAQHDFLQRLQTGGTVENDLFERVFEFLVRYQDTY